jgi:hypothetical protein
VIVGLHGKLGSGKNEAAKRLALYSTLPVVEVSFAKKLKESFAALLNVPVANLELWKNDPSKVVTVGGLFDGLGFVPLDSNNVLTIREALQRYGTEAHRDVFGADFWLDAALPLDKDYSDALYVVTDARFPNELERVRSLDGVAVGIIGPNDDTGSHASEQPLECDVWINNTSRDDNYLTLDTQLRSRITKPYGIEHPHAA